MYILYFFKSQSFLYNGHLVGWIKFRQFLCHDSGQWSLWCLDVKFSDDMNAIWTMSYSAVTLVSWSWKTKIVSFWPGMCWQWRRLLGPILVVANSKLADASPRMVIWFLNWKWHSFCDITSIVLQIKLYFVLNVYLYLIWKQGAGILYEELIILQLLFLFRFKLCLKNPC